ncbi:hypothetical protein DIKCMJMK_01298 [Shewanella oneidensis]|uniref:Lambda phage uncharacterized protein n=1 Tax=Shewanella oneidensis (strain ATCC 700550 / JCM 31522 / CIP 106686 / LMG 19005 / NCIMB 14063 / MR-1) TaxID=211586 RepID=K4PSI2_SHEON|nr:Lambda phage uncharacterized protein [Shewanella oneidensis MR-1]MEE2027439.1 hypothetical protein [Shewanella oneidensis]
MGKCVKCGSSSIEFQFVEDGTNLGTCKDQGKMSEFIRYVSRTFDYQIICKKEHLLKTCRCCKYAWREHTLDNATANQSPPGDD